MNDRPETGPMEFKDDWTGIFIRGDNAFYYAAQLNAILELMREEWGEGFAGFQIALESLKSLLSSCNHNTAQDKQLMKSFEESKR